MDASFEVSGRSGQSGLAARPGAGIDVASLVARLGPLLAGWVVPFALVLYLGLEGGGYDPLVSDQVGIVVWWLVVLAALVGILRFARIGAVGWVGFGLLLAFAAWTALGVSWSSSSEQSVAQIALVLTYLGVFALRPRRLALVPRLAVVGAGSAILIASADQRNALANGLDTAHAQSQG